MYHVCTRNVGKHIIIYGIIVRNNIIIMLLMYVRTVWIRVQIRQRLGRPRRSPQHESILNILILMSARAIVHVRR